jgi:hypothetical protein
MMKDQLYHFHWEEAWLDLEPSRHWEWQRLNTSHSHICYHIKKLHFHFRFNHDNMDGQKTRVIGEVLKKMKNVEEIHLDIEGPIDVIQSLQGNKFKKVYIKHADQQGLEEHEIKMIHETLITETLEAFHLGEARMRIF